MKSNTNSTDKQTAVVLTHPRFDRPVVENERRAGRKKGVISISSAQHRRWMFNHYKEKGLRLIDDLTGKSDSANKALIMDYYSRLQCSAANRSQTGAV